MVLELESMILNPKKRSVFILFNKERTLQLLWIKSAITLLRGSSNLILNIFSSTFHSKSQVKEER